MAKKLTEGDTVQIADRETTAADTKSGLFYPHYRGLQGTLGKVYADDTATVNVSPESLTSEIKARHEAGTQGMRQKWLDGLSDEARNRLSAAEKKFALRYTVLVALDDVAPYATSTPPVQTKLNLDAEAETTASRKSLADLEAEEARHLDEISKKSQK
jgi:hypothetical protein